MRTIRQILSREPVYLGAFIDAVVTAIVVPMNDIAGETKTLILSAVTAFIAWLVRVASVPVVKVDEQLQEATNAGITAGALAANENMGLLAMTAAPAKKAAPVRKAVAKRAR